jgi:hypothetical protein|tara:strand:+ start:1674 stop:2432 length:759 start_codon:yes stop_codon:yes gene_type:complete
MENTKKQLMAQVTLHLEQLTKNEIKLDKQRDHILALEEELTNIKRESIAELYDRMMHQLSQTVYKVAFNGDMREDDLGWLAQVQISQKLLDGSYFLLNGYQPKDANRDRKQGLIERADKAHKATQDAINGRRPFRELAEQTAALKALSTTVQQLDAATRSRLFGMTGNTALAYGEPKIAAAKAAHNLPQQRAEATITDEEAAQLKALGFEVDASATLSDEEFAARTRLNQAADKDMQAANDIVKGEADQKVS